MSAGFALPSTDAIPSPRLRAIAWLVTPARSLGPEEDAELRQCLFRRFEAIIASAVVALAIAGLSAYRHPTPAFLSWLILDLAIASVRLPLAFDLTRRRHPLHRRRGQPNWRLDIFIGLGTVWSALVGYGAMLCFGSSDPGMSILASLLAMGTVGGMCARNPGAPRLNTLQMSLIIAPLAIGAAMSTIPYATYAVVLAPLYLAGMFSITRELHADYVNLIVARCESRRLALHCPLTDLPNRSFFNERLARALEAAKAAQHPVAVMFLDLDGFKAVNDRLGHKAGDILLKQVAGRLDDVAGRVDAVAGAGRSVARFGGDEFAVIVESGEPDEVEATARALIASVSLPYALGGELMATIGISIGIARGLDADRLLAWADEALYAAKRGGKGTFRWHDDEGVARLRAVAQRMQDAYAPELPPAAATP